jgi:integrase
MLEMLLGSDGKRKLRLRHKTNDELFQLYDAQLILRYQTKDTLDEARRLLRHFREFVGESPPSPELAASFLARFVHLKSTSVHRYHALTQGFMVWYGERLDFKIKVPEVLPDYVEDADLEKLKAAMASKKTHKKVIERNLLLIELACKTGLRRGELADLKVGDINLERQYLVVKLGKGQKDRIIDLTPSLADQLRNYLKGKHASESVFGLTAGTISGLIHFAAKKAGVNIRTHSLRHFFASRLVDNGTDIEVVRRLLGHSSLNNTKKYLARTDKQRREAIMSLDSKAAARPESTSDVANERLSTQTSAESPRILNRQKDRTGNETAHAAAVRCLAVTLAESIALPSITDRSLWRELPFTKPGTYYLALGSATVGDDCSLVVTYPMPRAGASDHLERSLEAHLTSSGLDRFSGFVGDGGLVSIWSREVGNYSRAALSMLSLTLNKIARKWPDASPIDAVRLGPTKSFAITAWHDVIEGAQGHRWIDETWYRPPEKIGDLWVLRCGGLDIAYHSDLNGLNDLRALHKDLRSDFEITEAARVLERKRQELDGEAARLRGLLQEFGDFEHILGRCELCEPTSS